VRGFCLGSAIIVNLRNNGSIGVLGWHLNGGPKILPSSGQYGSVECCIELCAYGFESENISVIARKNCSIYGHRAATSIGDTKYCPAPIMGK
jgi:hypothetical protein